jgi:hypothetical protein
MSNHQGYWLAPLFVGLTALAAPPTAAGQILIPPNNGFNATIVLPSTIDAFYTGLNKGLEEAGDGINDLGRTTKIKKVHGGKSTLDGLQPGAAVVVDYTVKGIQASPDQINQADPDTLRANEGAVTRVDRSRKEITVKFAHGATQTLRAAGETERDSSRVVVYRADESGGRRVPRFFKVAR